MWEMCSRLLSLYLIWKVHLVWMLLQLEKETKGKQTGRVLLAVRAQHREQIPVRGRAYARQTQGKLLAQLNPNGYTVYKIHIKNSIVTFCLHFCYCKRWLLVNDLFSIFLIFLCHGLFICACVSVHEQVGLLFSSSVVVWKMKLISGQWWGQSENKWTVGNPFWK